MRGRQSACCFTGHRPGKLPWRYNEEDLRCVLLKARIADAVEAAYQEGFRHFLCGMALGCDLYFCECVLRLRQTHPDVTVEAAVPCPSQADAWPPDQRRRYERLVAACDFETLVSACYTPACRPGRLDAETSGASAFFLQYGPEPLRGEPCCGMLERKAI